MSDNDNPAIAELEQKLLDYELTVDAQTVASMLLSLMIGKGPDEMRRWFSQLAMDLHHVRQ
jgi:hypothetical protein